MTNEEFYTAIEQLNKEKKEILKRKEYKLGRHLCNLISLIKTFKFNCIYNYLKEVFISKKLQKMFILSEKDLVDNFSSNNSESFLYSKIATYTCIIGDYDNLQIPLVNFDNVDMYLITDDPEKYKDYEKYYKIIKLSDEILSKGDILANRYVKFHPHKFFPNYDFSIYLDGNIRIISDIRKFTSACTLKTGIAMHRHRSRVCLYDESEACRLLKRGDSNKIQQQILNYQTEGFPRKFGLTEAGVITADLKNPNSEKLLTLWWEELIRSESLRDQIAFPYVLWKNRYQLEDVGNLGPNISDNSKLELSRHF